MIRAVLFVCLLGVLPDAVLADEPSFALTSDTPAYCAQLARKVADAKSTLPEIKKLLTEGRDMCDRGQIRGGIHRLRRALVALHHKAAKED